MVSQVTSTHYSKSDFVRGFTLIELLVVIAIISLLGSVVTATLSGTREDARKVTARAELNSLHNAIQLLVNDTGKYPNGCQPGRYSNPEIRLSAPNAGLVSEPTVGNQGTGCVWTSRDIQRWDGPYVDSENITDPWGNSYWYDPDYLPYRECSEKPNEPGTVVIFSFGPNEVGVNQYDCDDIYLPIK